MIALSVVLMSVSFSICVLGSAYSAARAPIAACMAGASLFFIASLAAFLCGVAR